MNKPLYHSIHNMVRANDRPSLPASIRYHPITRFIMNTHSKRYYAVLRSLQRKFIFFLENASLFKGISSSFVPL